MCKYLLNNKKSFWFVRFSMFKYIQLSSAALRQWINDVSQKARDYLIDKLLERVGAASSP